MNLDGAGVENIQPSKKLIMVSLRPSRFGGSPESCSCQLEFGLLNFQSAFEAEMNLIFERPAEAAVANRK
ncbi:MAG TPA: hypothetical protein VHG33_03720 [Woeseiaceae bacterium]|nr:hypothetical protein [Woeseiaceae bacterium]